MLLNYLTVAFRSLRKNRGFSLINIVGLALGMACSLLIFLWVRDEYSVDAFHKNVKNLYLLYETQYVDGKPDGGYYTPGLLAAELKRKIPEVEMATMFDDGANSTFAAGDKIIKETGGSASEDFFKMFSYKLIDGKEETALKDPSSIAISKNMADAFFGSPEAAMGKTLRYQNEKDFKVSAVYEDMPAQSSTHQEYMLTWAQALEEGTWMKDWGNNGPRTIIQLRADANPTQVRRKIFRFLDAYNKEQSANFQIRLHMQPYGETYLNSHFRDGAPDGGRIEYVHLFSLVAVFILLIACINFMNLSTARSMKRAKEIGVRKVMGAPRKDLIRQFLGEALLLAILSSIVALVIITAVLPAFNTLTGKEIALPYAQPDFWALWASLVAITGLISGSYPALYLSSFNPINVLKGGKNKTSGSAIWFRKGLVVFQFAASILLIISTMLISRQINYVQKANLGYERQNVLYVPQVGELHKSQPFQSFINEAQTLPGVRAVSAMGADGTTDIENSTGGVQWTGKDPNSSPMFTQLPVAYDFAKTLKLSFAQGRDFDRAYPTDSVGFILNEAALKIVGYKNPIGQPLTFWGIKGRIIGIVRDFHYTSLHEPILPMVIRLGKPEATRSILVSIQPGEAETALKSLGQLYKAVNPAFPFTYRFLEADYEALYKSDEVVNKLSTLFALLAIVTSCLGLLGLSMFTVEERTKEIGIRKVLGAGVANLVANLSTGFVALICIAFVIAAPLSWWAMNRWLAQYAYQTDTPWWIFALSGILAIAIGLATICFHTVKAALANPIKSLRAE